MTKFHSDEVGGGGLSLLPPQAVAAERADLKAAAVLLGAASRHVEPLAPVRGDEITSACIDRTQAGIDGAAFDLAAVQRQIDTMTLDDLITMALESLA